MQRVHRRPAAGAVMLWRVCQCKLCVLWLASLSVIMCCLIGHILTTAQKQLCRNRRQLSHAQGDV